MLQFRLKKILQEDLDSEVYIYLEGVLREYEGSDMSIEDVRCV
jgi:hypothetical protein